MRGGTVHNEFVHGFYSDFWELSWSIQETLLPDSIPAQIGSDITPAIELDHDRFFSLFWVQPEV